MRRFTCKLPTGMRLLGAEQVHEPVHHFAVEDSDEESLPGKLEADNGTDPRIFRRESGADLAWHMNEMRRHHEQLEEAKRELKEDTVGQSRFSAAALMGRHKTRAKKELGGVLVIFYEMSWSRSRQVLEQIFSL